MTTLTCSFSLLTHHVRYKSGDSWKCNGCHGSLRDDGTGGKVRKLYEVVRTRSIDDFLNVCPSPVYTRQKQSIVGKGLMDLIPELQFIWQCMKFPLPDDTEKISSFELGDAMDVDENDVKNIARELSVFSNFELLKQLKNQNSYLLLILGRSFYSGFDTLYDGIKTENMKRVTEGKNI